MQKLRLGVNIDHVATLRNARGGVHPCPVKAAKLAVQAGADGITLHLREDRRHIVDEDVRTMRRQLQAPMNLEMAATKEMQQMALEMLPHAVCLVPEKREERTTEGGLEVAGQLQILKEFIAPLNAAAIRVSLFVAPDIAQIEAAKHAGAKVVELHTGHYANLSGQAQHDELQEIIAAAQHAASIGLEVHAGHGLTYNNVGNVAAIKEVVELNIGHFLMGEAIFDGLATAIQTMRRYMDEARVKGKAA